MTVQVDETLFSFLRLGGTPINFKSSRIGGEERVWQKNLRLQIPNSYEYTKMTEGRRYVSERKQKAGPGI